MRVRAVIALAPAAVLVELLAVGVAAAQVAPPAAQPPPAGVADFAPAPAAGERVTVTIHQFRSQLPVLAGNTATGMFTTALVKTGRFHVLERARMDERVVRGKQLHRSGWASGNTALPPLKGTQFVFEGVVSEANTAKSSSDGIGAVGLQVGGGSSRDSIVIDVQIADAVTGEVVDAVTVRKPILASNSAVGGSGALLGEMHARKGRDTTYVPDVQARPETCGGIDAALRAAIDDAVAQIAGRFGT